MQMNLFFSYYLTTHGLKISLTEFNVSHFQHFEKTTHKHCPSLHVYAKNPRQILIVLNNMWYHLVNSADT
jgi:hypothetical protein